MPTPMQALLSIAAIRASEIPATARTMARFSLFDWLVVARAGSNEPVAGIVRDYALSEAGTPSASMFGTSTKLPARNAALANGTISHALDYDDTHFAHVGHPSVAIMPAAIAIAEREDLPAAAIADAFLLGAEASCRIGMALGRQHYEKGFHQTATAGAFGATLAAGYLLELGPKRMQAALSLVSTRASGLKSQFGTMGKPFNAGIAASNGVEAAELARRGFVSCDDGVAGIQGFIETHSDQPGGPEVWTNPPPDHFVFEDIKYKFHACCHGTHAMIEALLTSLRSQAIRPDDVAALELRVNPRWLRVCDIKSPRTGLEVKFSYAFLAAMVFHAIDTSNDTTYQDKLATDPRLLAFAKKVRVTGDATVGDMDTQGTLSTVDGTQKAIQHDLSRRLPDHVIETGLRKKAAALLGQPSADRIWSAISDLDHLTARNIAALMNG